MRDVTIEVEGKQSSNCTFMELKSWIVGENVAGIRSSNCTFMELKDG